MGFFKRLARHKLWGLLSLAFAFFIVAGFVIVAMYSNLPDTSTLKNVRLQEPLRVYTSDNQLIATFGSKWRSPIPLEQVPKNLINAILATEDQRFFDHPGVDPIGLIRAAKAVLISGRKSQGASTITMQVARNFFLSPEKTYLRKLREILLAIKIDHELPKDKILELYLNKVYFGKRAYGVVAAAQVYYGKTPEQLTLAQMAMLAGLPQSPSVNNPINDPANAKIRRDHVLSRMLNAQFITQKQYEEAIATPITATYHYLPIDCPAPYIAEMVRNAMVSRYGEDAYDYGFSVYTTINCSMQQYAQQALEKGLIAFSDRHGYWGATDNWGTPPAQLAEWTQKLSILHPIANLMPAAVLAVQDNTFTALLANGNQITVNWEGMRWARHRIDIKYLGPVPNKASDIVKVGDVIRVLETAPNQWALSQIPKVQGALVALNPINGALLALTGGFHYSASVFNRAIQAERQPGSAMKPFLYSAALEKGFTLASTINDAPVVIEDTGENELWRPRNDSRQFYGPTRLRVALAKSRNLVSIRLLQAIGIPYALSYLEQFGIDTKNQPNSLSLALGTGSMTPLELSNAFAVFANGGYRVTPYFIDHIVDSQDSLVNASHPALACEDCISHPDLAEDKKPNPMAPQVISSQNAYLITQALKDVIQEGTAKAAQTLQRDDLAGKTGTTNKQIDAWFSGFNNHLVATVWVGYDNMHSINEYGADAALPIWIDFMKNALKDQPQADLPEPPGLVRLRIDKNTGLLTNTDNTNSVFEIFRQDFAPKTYSTITTTPSPSSDTSSEQNESNNAGADLF